MAEQPRRPDQQYSPPLPSLAAGARAGVFRGFLVIIAGSGSGKGIFVYSPTAGSGNLVDSVTAPGVTSDPFGNAVPTSGGFVSYGSTGYAELTSGSLIFHLTSDAGDAGVVPLAATGGASGVPGLIVTSPTNLFTAGDNTQAILSLVGTSADGTKGPYAFIASNQFGSSAIKTVPFLLVGSFAFAAPASAGGSVVSEGPTLLPNGANGMLLASSAADTPVTAALLELQVGTGQTAYEAIEDASGSNSFACRVSGDTNDRLTISGSGGHHWGSGSAITDVALTRSAANTLQLATADFDVSSAGRGLRVAEGSNAKQGTSTLSAGTVVVANTSVTANSRIFLTAQTSGAAPGALRVSARTAGTSFTITSTSNTDTSVVAWEIFEPG